MARQWDPEQHTFVDSSPVAPARRKVLAAATRLFYDEGVRTVGVDRLVAEAQVSKNTFYKHFGSRDNLIQEYVELLCTKDRQALAGAIKTSSTAQGIIDAVVELVAGEILAPRYQGSALLNAAASYPDRDHPVRVRINAHTARQKAALEVGFQCTSRVLASQLAATLSLAIVGTHGAATLGDRDQAVTALRAGVSLLLAA